MEDVFQLPRGFIEGVGPEAAAIAAMAILRGDLDPRALRGRRDG